MLAGCKFFSVLRHPKIDEALEVFDVDLAQAAQPGEDFGNWPAVMFDHRLHALGQNALDILQQSAAGDMGERPDPARRDRGQAGLHIDPRRR